MLCLTCGKFGHYKDGCPEKIKVPAAAPEVGGNQNSVDNQAPALVGGNWDGPWKVVQKPKRGKKVAPNRQSPTTEGRNNTGPGIANAVPNNINVEPYIAGSRFVSLRDEIPEINASDIEKEEDAHREEDNVVNIKDVGTAQEIQGQPGHTKRAKHGISSKKGDGNPEKTMKDTKLAARGKGSFKGRNVAAIKKGIENVFDKMGDNVKEKTNKEGLVIRSTTELQEDVIQEGVGVSHRLDGTRGLDLGQKGVQHPNNPRPPNLQVMQHGNTIIETVILGEVAVDSELFLDAQENGSMGNVDSDMELVEETPGLTQ
ncbi:hypothetical protein P8452_40243 [Trifolium repens]|nr:hypothetical protein P8452_40243 [Trifolium repens]